MWNSRFGLRAPAGWENIGDRGTQRGARVGAPANAILLQNAEINVFHNMQNISCTCPQKTLG